MKAACDRGIKSLRASMAPDVMDVHPDVHKIPDISHSEDEQGSTNQGNEAVEESDVVPMMIQASRDTGTNFCIESSKVNTELVTCMNNSGEFVEDLSSNVVNIMAEKEFDAIEEVSVTTLIGPSTVLGHIQCIQTPLIQYRDSDHVQIATLFNDYGVVSNYKDTQDFPVSPAAMINSKPSTIIMDSAAVDDVVDPVEVPIAWDLCRVHNNIEILNSSSKIVSPIIKHKVAVGDNTPLQKDGQIGDVRDLFDEMLLILAPHGNDAYWHSINSWGVISIKEDCTYSVVCLENVNTFRCSLLVQVSLCVVPSHSFAELAGQILEKVAWSIIWSLFPELYDICDCTHLSIEMKTCFRFCMLSQFDKFSHTVSTNAAVNQVGRHARLLNYLFKLRSLHIGVFVSADDCDIPSGIHMIKLQLSAVSFVSGIGLDMLLEIQIKFELFHCVCHHCTFHYNVCSWYVSLWIMATHPKSLHCSFIGIVRMGEIEYKLWQLAYDSGRISFIKLTHRALRRIILHSQGQQFQCSIQLQGAYLSNTQADDVCIKTFVLPILRPTTQAHFYMSAASGNLNCIEILTENRNNLGTMMIFLLLQSASIPSKSRLEIRAATIIPSLGDRDVRTRMGFCTSGSVLIHCGNARAGGAYWFECFTAIGCSASHNGMVLARTWFYHFDPCIAYIHNKHYLWLLQHKSTVKNLFSDSAEQLECVEWCHGLHRSRSCLRDKETPNCVIDDWSIVEITIDLALCYWSVRTISWFNFMSLNPHADDNCLGRTYNEPYPMLFLRRGRHTTDFPALDLCSHYVYLRTEFSPREVHDKRGLGIHGYVVLVKAWSIECSRSDSPSGAELYSWLTKLGFIKSIEKHTRLDIRCSSGLESPPRLHVSSVVITVGQYRMEYNSKRKSKYSVYALSVRTSNDFTYDWYIAEAESRWSFDPGKHIGIWKFLKWFSAGLGHIGLWQHSASTIRHTIWQLDWVTKMRFPPVSNYGDKMMIANLYALLSGLLTSLLLAQVENIYGHIAWLISLDVNKVREYHVRRGQWHSWVVSNYASIVHKVVFVGRSTKCSQANQCLQGFLTGMAPCKRVNAEAVVAYGFAIQTVAYGSLLMAQYGIVATDGSLVAFWWCIAWTPLSANTVRSVSPYVNTAATTNVPATPKATKSSYTTSSLILYSTHHMNVRPEHVPPPTSIRSLYYLSTTTLQPSPAKVVTPFQLHRVHSQVHPYTSPNTIIAANPPLSCLLSIRLTTPPTNTTPKNTTMTALSDTMHWSMPFNSHSHMVKIFKTI